MKTVAERGVYGQWLVNARMARGDTTQEAALARLLKEGYRISKSVYAEYESGSKRPSKTHLPMLEAVWGKLPEAKEPPQDALVIALTRQAAAIESLVAELAKSRLAQVEATEAALEGIAALGPRPSPEGKRSGTAPASPAGTRR